MSTTHRFRSLVAVTAALALTATAGLSVLAQAEDAGKHFSVVEAASNADSLSVTQIAEKTGGEYFRATDNQTLQQVYDKINELEKTKIETDDFTKYTELYTTYALIALALLVFEFLIGKLWLRRIP